MLIIVCEEFLLEEGVATLILRDEEKISSEGDVRFRVVKLIALRGSRLRRQIGLYQRESVTVESGRTIGHS